MSAKYQAVRGTHDILPAEAAQFQQLEAHARTLFKQFGFQEIRTPTFESLDLFQRSIGETTDIVEKEMYSFEDAMNGDKLTLRPENTAGIVAIELLAAVQGIDLRLPLKTSPALQRAHALLRAKVRATAAGNLDRFLAARKGG